MVGENGVAFSRLPIGRRKTRRVRNLPFVPLTQKNWRPACADRQEPNPIRRRQLVSQTYASRGTEGVLLSPQNGKRRGYRTLHCKVCISLTYRFPSRGYTTDNRFNCADSLPTLSPASVPACDSYCLDCDGRGRRFKTIAGQFALELGQSNDRNN
jgi:hypothetical protein